MPVTLSRKAYATMYGPTSGDRIRLAQPLSGQRLRGQGPAFHQGKPPFTSRLR